MMRRRGQTCEQEGESSVEDMLALKSLSTGKVTIPKVHLG